MISIFLQLKNYLIITYILNIIFRYRGGQNQIKLLLLVLFIEDKWFD